MLKRWSRFCCRPERVSGKVGLNRGKEEGSSERKGLRRVIYIEAFDIFAMVFLNYVDEIVNRSIFISDKNFAI